VRLPGAARRRRRARSAPPGASAAIAPGNSTRRHAAQSHKAERRRAFISALLPEASPAARPDARRHRGGAQAAPANRRLALAASFANFPPPQGGEGSAPRKPVANPAAAALGLRAATLHPGDQQGRRAKGGAHVTPKGAQCRRGSIGSNGDQAQPQQGAGNRSESKPEGAYARSRIKAMVTTVAAQPRRVGRPWAWKLKPAAQRLATPPGFPHRCAAARTGRLRCSWVRNKAECLGRHAAQRPAAKGILLWRPNALRRAALTAPAGNAAGSDQGPAPAKPMADRQSSMSGGRNRVGAVGLDNSRRGATLSPHRDCGRCEKFGFGSKIFPISTRSSFRALESMWFPQAAWPSMSPRPLKRWMCNWPAAKTIEVV